MKVTTWIIATHNSDEAEIYLHKKFGNAYDVADTIWDMMVHDRKNDEENFYEDASYDRCEIEENDGIDCINESVREDDSSNVELHCPYCHSSFGVEMDYNGNYYIGEEL